MKVSYGSSWSEAGGESRPARLSIGATSVFLTPPDVRKDVRELLHGGPPFDPEDSELTLHEVFLLEDEALFLFEIDGATSIESVVEADFWEATGVWRDLIEGGVRLAEPVFGWAREGSRGAPAGVGLGY